MATEVFYYRDSDGSCPVQDFLDKLDYKARARCLAQIDLLEGEELPSDLDRIVEDTPIRVLGTTHNGRTHNRVAYFRRGDQTILVAATRGRYSKLQHGIQHGQLKQIVAALMAAPVIAPEHLKSHREHVAEITLNDPAQAALYSRYREHMQFAASVVRLRSSVGFSVEALAERTGLSLARVESMERGRLPKLATMRRLVDSLQARIVIAPGSGISIEPYVVETKRAHRARRARPDTAPEPSLSLADAK
jgi:transcriptional regulator with XRE-family HTH domain